VTAGKLVGRSKKEKRKYWRNRKPNMKNKYNLIAIALVLTAAFALTANAASPSYSAYGPGGVSLGGIHTPDATLWYNGDFDGTNGLANEQNTIVSQAGVYEDFNVTGGGWNITSLFSDNLLNTTVTGANWEIRSGVSEGSGGTLIASGTTNAPLVTLTGRSGFGFLEYMVQVTGINVTLAPGHYWMNVTPVGNGGGRSFNSTTSGANCVGTPCGNNQMAFFNSTFFGATFTSTANEGQPTDFSDGVIGTVVPEPATVALLTCGLGAVVIAIRRRRA
jgi:hypothetical protein